MAIAGYKPSETEVPDTYNLPETKDYKTSVVNNQRIPIESIIQYIEGAEWEVDYYSQLVDTNDPVTPHDLNLPDVLQQYTKIHDFILHVDSALEPQQYQPENYIQVTGTANYYNAIPPNVGDMFVAKLIGNRTGVFTVNNVQRKTYNNETVYGIEYNLVSIVEEDDEQFNDLESKVVKEYYYDKDNLLANVSPLLTTKDYNVKLNLKYEFRRLVDYFLTNFAHKDKKILLLPAQTTAIYDSLLVDFVFKFFNTTDSMMVRDIVKLNISNPYLEQPTIWTAMLERDINILDYCNRRMEIISTGSLSMDPMFRSAVFSGVGNVIYPARPDTTTDQLGDWPISTISSNLVEPPTNYIDLIDIINTTLTHNNITLIPKVTEDENYVFTEKFYTVQDNLTVIESLTLSYIRKEPLDIYGLNELIKTYRKWGRLEQYYFIPVLICLIRDTVQTTFSVV